MILLSLNTREGMKNLFIEFNINLLKKQIKKVNIVLYFLIIS